MRSTASRTWSWATDLDLWRRAALTLVVIGGLLAFLLIAPRGYDWKWSAVWRDGQYASYIFGGLWVTFYVSMGALVIAMVLGVAAGLARLSRGWVVNQLSTIYVELIRGTPLLVQIYVAWFCITIAVRDSLEAMGAGPTLLEFSQEKLLWGILTLGVFAGAYVAEIVRGALLSIDKGQTEAALSQGMTRGQVFRYVLFPQAMRRMVPPLTGQFVSLVKDSSLLSAIAILELTKRGSEVRGATHNTFEVFLPLAAMYLAICFPLSWLARRLELRLVE